MSYQPRRPGLAVAAGIIFVVFGCSGMSNAFCGGSGMVLQQAFIQPPAPGEDANLLDGIVEPEVAKEVPSAPVVEVTAFGINLLLSLGMLVAGVGILQLNPMARWLGMVVAVGDIIVTLAHTSYRAILIMPIENRLLQAEAPNMPPGAFDIIEMAQSAGLGMAAMKVLVTLAIWIAVLYMLNTKDVVAAFGDEIESSESPRPRRRSRDDDFDDEPSPRQRRRPRDDDYDDEAPPPPRQSDDTGITDRP